MNLSIRKYFLVIFLGLITLAQASLAQTASTSTNISVESKNGTQRWRTSSGLNSFNVEFRGRIDISDDDKEIKGMSPDGYLEISKTVFGSKRSIVIESLGDLRFKKQYYEGRTLINWEPAGREWLSEILPEVVRTTTLCAESRVNRMFKQGGADAVMNEIGKMESDYVRSHYANLLMKQPLPAKDYATLINKIAEGTDSDHYLTEFLKNNMDKFMQNKEATTALFSATRKMDSDHYKTVVIKEALEENSASLENVKIILQAAGQMESDHYITEVLTSLLKQDNLTDAIVSELILTTQSIESDHYKTVVLTQALGKTGLSATSYQRVVESVKTIESDHYITQVIGHLLNNKLTDEVLTTLLTIIPSIESDHYRTEVLTTLLKRQDLKEEQFDKLMQAFNTMDSDHYKTVVLQQALVSGTISESKITKVLQMAQGIESDHYITEVLVRAAPRVKSGSSALKETYRAAAKRISSETYYGRALRAIE